MPTRRLDERTGISFLGMARTRRKKIGLALSGGAARGFAHIGVVKVLQENDIPISCVAGTSVGAIVGAFVAAGYSWEKMLKIADDIKWHALIAPTLSGMGLVKTDRLESFIDEMLGEMTFDELEIPFGAVAADIVHWETVVFDSGPVGRAVRASASVPMVFEPLVEDDVVFVDGGVTNNIPCDVVRSMGAGRVIAVDLNAERLSSGVPANLFDVGYRCFALLLDMTSAAGRKEADVLIQPDIGEFDYHDLSRREELVSRGEAAAKRVLKKLARL